MKLKIKNFLKENLIPIIFLIAFAFIVNYELPYYISAPGGTINLTERIDKDYNKKKGSLNMLYVTEFRGNVVTVLLGKLFKSWDVYEIKNQQISNENSEEIYLRNRVMLDNSIQNAIFVAYNAAGKKINIKGEQNIVIATTKDNGIKIGDIITGINNEKISNVDEIKSNLSKYKIGDTITLNILRNNDKKDIDILLEPDGQLGVVIITNYQYDLEEDLDLNFRSGEGGSSGGLILTLGIYSEITGTDILKGRDIAGTGTIDINGNVGNIDGIKYKIAGAVKNKMDIVLIPTGNYEEAKKVVKDNNYDIELVEIKTFKDAINYLVN